VEIFSRPLRENTYPALDAKARRNGLGF